MTTKTIMPVEMAKARGDESKTVVVMAMLKTVGIDHSDNNGVMMA